MPVVRSSTSKQSIEHQSVSIDFFFHTTKNGNKNISILQAKYKCDEMSDEMVHRDFSSVGWDVTF